MRSSQKLPHLEDGSLEVGDSVPKPLGFNALAAEWLLRSIPWIPMFRRPAGAVECFVSVGRIFSKCPHMAGFQVSTED